MYSIRHDGSLGSVSGKSAFTSTNKLNGGDGGVGVCSKRSRYLIVYCTAAFQKTHRGTSRCTVFGNVSRPL